MWAQAILRRVYQASDVKTAQRLLLDLARRLEAEYPNVAKSVREGLDETLTVLTLKLSPLLARVAAPPGLRAAGCRDLTYLANVRKPDVIDFRPLGLVRRQRDPPVVG